jgi:hypothetical protein
MLCISKVFPAVGTGCDLSLYRDRPLRRDLSLYNCDLFLYRLYLSQRQYIINFNDSMNLINPTFQDQKAMSYT